MAYQCKAERGNVRRNGSILHGQAGARKNAYLSIYFSFSRKSTPIVFLYVSVYSPVQNRRIIDDFPTPPFPTTITLMVAVGIDYRRGEMMNVLESGTTPGTHARHAQGARSGGHRETSTAKKHYAAAHNHKELAHTYGS